MYHVKVVTTFLKASVPFNKIELFRDLLEDNAYRLTDRRNMLDYVPFILKDEDTICQKISELNPGFLPIAIFECNLKPNMNTTAHAEYFGYNGIAGVTLQSADAMVWD